MQGAVLVEMLNRSAASGHAKSCKRLRDAYREGNLGLSIDLGVSMTFEQRKSEGQKFIPTNIGRGQFWFLRAPPSQPFLSLGDTSLHLELFRYMPSAKFQNFKDNERNPWGVSLDSAYLKEHEDNLAIQVEFETLKKAHNHKILVHLSVANECFDSCGYEFAYQQYVSTSKYMPYGELTGLTEYGQLQRDIFC